MPRKVRQLIADLKKAGFVDRGGKGSHRNFTHPKGLRVTISGGVGDDAKQYQERDVRRALDAVKNNSAKAQEGKVKMKRGVLSRRQIKEQAARYTKFVEWSDEDQCFIGRCPEIMAGGVHGSDEARVYAELCQAVEEMLQLIYADGHTLPKPLAAKKFSGKFVLRLEPAMHRRLAAKALAAGESLNSYCAKTLVKA